MSAKKTKRGPEPLTSLSTPAKWGTLSEIAAYGRMSQRHLRRLILLGRVPVFELSPRKRLVRFSDIDALMVPKPCGSVVPFEAKGASGR